MCGKSVVMDANHCNGNMLTSGNKRKCKSRIRNKKIHGGKKKRKMIILEITRRVLTSAVIGATLGTITRIIVEETKRRKK